MLVALAECCILGGVGVRCPALATGGELGLAEMLFAESQSRFIVSAGPRAVPELQGLGRRHRVELTMLGLAGGEVIELEGQLRAPLARLRAAWEGGLLPALHAPAGGA
jgi:phosphoribosylformylglycinamidine (FGAM) synthase-like enzyme